MNQETKKTGPLKIIIPLIIISIGLFFYLFGFGGSSLEHIANSQLQALRDKDIPKAYYDYTSLGYQREVPLSDFRKFVRTNTVFSDNSGASFYQKHTENGQGALVATLKGSDGSVIPVIYLFKQENGAWKISDIQINDYGVTRLNAHTSDIAAASQTKRSAQNPELTQPVLEQLKLLQAKDTEKAYNGFVSKEFVKATPLDAFFDFVSQFPELSNHESVTVQKSKIEGDKGMVSVILKHDDKSYPVDYTLVRQDGEWKIWGFRIMPPLGSVTNMSPEERESAIQIVKGNLNMLNNGNAKEAYDNMASKEFKQETDYKEFMEFLKSYPELENFQSYRFGESKVENGLRMVQVYVESPMGESLVDYWLTKEDGEWKIWGIHVQESANYPPVEEEEKIALLRVIEGQLAALKEHDYSKAYYAYASDEFENATPLDAFKKFAASHPILSDYTGMNFDEGVKEGNLRLVRIKLQNPSESQAVDFRLVKQGGAWKVWGIQMLEQEKNPEPKGQTAVLAVIKDQLQAIRENDLSKAYYAFSAKDFQKHTSRDSFKKFLNSHPVLYDYSNVDLEDYKEKGNTALATVLINSEDETPATFEYHLVEENGKWKIMGVESMKGDATGDILKISKAVIGSEANSEGIITAPKNMFRKDDGEIYLNLFIEDGKPGDTVTVTLEHMPSTASIEPVTTTLEHEGESVLTLTFNPPAQGWPPGKYRFTTSTSSGIDTEYSFNVLEY